MWHFTHTKKKSFFRLFFPPKPSTPSANQNGCNLAIEVTAKPKTKLPYFTLLSEISYT